MTFMKEAVKEAYKALDEDEVPVGAVIVCNNVMIAKAHNQAEQLKDSTAHAEMLALTAAMEHLGSKFLKESTLYVTLEPCPMCAYATRLAQLGKIVFGALDKKQGFLRFKKQLSNDKRNTRSILHPKTKLVKGVLEEICSDLMVDFFSSKRNS